MKKIIIVDDQLSFRKSLKKIISKISDAEIIAEASNGKEFLELLNEKIPDIVFMDIQMPIMNGIIATKEALKKFPFLIIIGISIFENKLYIDEMLKVGGKGYLLKSDGDLDTFQTIIKYPKAEMFFSESLNYKRLKNNE